MTLTISPGRPRHSLVGPPLEIEAPISRRVLERVPEGRADWKPHEKSMPMGYRAQLVATMPGWIAMMILQDLATKWQLLVGGRVVDENPRHVTIASTFTHLAHHRGQLTVYLRLNGEGPVGVRAVRGRPHVRIGEWRAKASEPFNV